MKHSNIVTWKLGLLVDKRYMSKMGLDRDYFHAITWFTSWAVDADHGATLSDVDATSHLEIM